MKKENFNFFRILIISVIVLFCHSTASWAQERDVTGTVKSGSGEPLLGVNVVVQGTTTGTISDASGNFSITVPSDDAILTFSYIGYVTQEVPVGNQTIINITLSENLEALDEVVVVGYGTQKKVNLTGAVTTVDAEQLANRPVTLTSSALQGLAPGVTVTQNLGTPGNDGANIRIRGLGSISSDNSPLVLLDGIMVDINDVNPEDIESMSVLKDAASAAIYGTRAANGVILITSKRGKAGKFSVDADFSYGAQMPTMLPDLVDVKSQFLYEEVKKINEGAILEWGHDGVQAYLDGYATYGANDQFQNNDWYNAVVKGSSPLHREQVSVSGGTDKVRSRMSFVNMSQDGLVENSSFNRNTFRTNVDINPLKWLSFSADLFVKRSEQVQPAQSISEIFHMVNELEPYRQLYVNNDLSFGDEKLWGWAWRGENPLAITKDGGNTTINNNYTMLNVNAVITPFRGFRVDLGYSNLMDNDVSKSFREAFPFYEAGANVGDPPSFSGTNPSVNSMNLTTRSRTQNYYKAIASYSNTFAENHNLTVLFGGDATAYNYSDQFGSRSNFPLGIDYPQLSLGDREGMDNGSYETQWSLASLLGRVNYDFKGKYLAEASFRYDGSSRFAADNRWGFFPSLSAGWRISEESFMESVPALNNLKIRASWGKLGNQNIGGNYPYSSLVDLDQPTILNETNQLGAAILQWAVPNITWEESKQTNFGLDFGFFGSKLYGSIDYYSKYNSNVLLILAQPLSSGLEPNYQNGAEIENKGWELVLGWRESKGNLSYYITGQLDDNKNKVVSLLGTGPYINGDHIRAEGDEFDALYGWETLDGFLTAAELDDPNVPKQESALLREGVLKFKDQDGNGVIDVDDRVVIGSEIPRYNFSLSAGVNWKGLALDVLLQGTGKRDGYVRKTGQSYGDHFYDWETDFYLEPTHPIFTDHNFDDFGLEPNTSAKYPALGADNGLISDFWIVSRAYLRIKSLSLSYTLPKSLTSNLRIGSVRIYVSAENLYTFTKFLKGFDPEMSSGRGYWQYPNVSKVLGGINITF
jgi:TonB-linked SusC/RagA family outer membrane protein